jgi:hypothetical protein
MDELPLLFDVLIEEFKYVVLPSRGRKVNEVVSVLRGSSPRYYNLGLFRSIQIIAVNS